MLFSPEVERWRSTVEKYVPKEHVDKFLYAMQGESGGDPSAIGDNGVAIGLMQIQDKTRFSNRPDKATLLDPEANIKYAAQQLGAAKGDFSAWGEGATYEGKPFGALGNNPYPGTTNARVSTARGVKSTAGQVGSSGDGVSPITDILGKPKAAAGKLGSILKTNQKRALKSGSVSPTGDYATDMGAYWAAAQKAYEELSKYQNDSDSLLNVDEKEGIVYRYDPEEDELVVDEMGSAILQRAIRNESAIDRLLAGKKAGLLDTGEASAAAFLTSEKEKSAKATTDYDDYIKRVSDLAAVEDIPMQRAASLASVIGAFNKNAASSGRTLNAGMGVSGRPAGTDFGPIASSMRGVLPKQAPAPYSMNPAALEPNMPTQIKIPAKPPEEVLASYGAVQPITIPSFSTGTVQPVQSGFSRQVPPWKRDPRLGALQSAFQVPSRFIR